MLESSERKSRQEKRDKERLETITDAYKEAERLRREAAAIEAVVKEKERVIAEEEEKESDRLRKIAEEEAKEHLERLQVIEEQENERAKRRKVAEIEDQTEFERLWRLKYTELYGGNILGNDLGNSFLDESIVGHTDQ